MKIILVITLLALIIFGIFPSINVLAENKKLSENNSILVAYNYRVSPGYDVCNGALCECGLYINEDDNNYSKILASLRSLSDEKEEFFRGSYEVQLFIKYKNEDWEFFNSGNLEHKFLDGRGQVIVESNQVSMTKMTEIAKLIEENAGQELGCQKGEIEYPLIGNIY
ncbi:MAG: hypothetical protein H6912_05540 [Kordiimonadaceae bacterium]|nr:hypothetical protein [Kordiimonadaceae bacterium]